MSHFAGKKNNRSYNIPVILINFRAQQDAVARKMKLEAKQSKGATKRQPLAPAATIEEPKHDQTSKLVNQIAVLKDQNKSLEGKVQVRPSIIVLLMMSRYLFIVLK